MTRGTLLVLAAGTLLCGLARTSFAQAPAPTSFPQAPSPAPIVRGDVAGLAGWQNLNKSDLNDRGKNDWVNRGFYGAGIAGWYWTDHHKTEIEVGASTAAPFWVYRPFAVENNFPAAGGSEFSFSTWRVAIAEQYQFFRNQWFHPHAAAGFDFTWETTTERAEPVILYPTQQPGQPRLIRPAAVIGPDTRLRVRPFGEVGFKAYVSPRGFLRSDLRMLARNGIDEVQVRFGFGVDF